MGADAGVLKISAIGNIAIDEHSFILALGQIQILVKFMNYNNITQAYQNAERQALEEMNDPHQIVLTLLDALLKSMQIFTDNIDLKNGGDAELKSKHFARS